MICEQQKLLHDTLKSFGTGFPWTMGLEDGWVESGAVWAIRDGNGNIISWVGQNTNEALLWHFVVSLLNKENIEGYYNSGVCYEVRPINK